MLNFCFCVIFGVFLYFVSWILVVFTPCPASFIFLGPKRDTNAWMTIRDGSRTIVTTRYTSRTTIFPHSYIYIPYICIYMCFAKCCHSYYESDYVYRDKRSSLIAYIIFIHTYIIDSYSIAWIPEYHIYIYKSTPHFFFGCHQPNLPFFRGFFRPPQSPPPLSHAISKLQGTPCASSWRLHCSQRVLQWCETHNLRATPQVEDAWGKNP